jgi:hypothetical protein
MSLKVTMFYNMEDDGWTETWYAPGTDPFNFAINLPGALFTAATYFRAANVDLFALRATLIDSATRKSYTLPLAGRYPSPASASSSSGQPDNPTTDALYNIYDGLGNRKKTYFRGLLDAQVQWTTAKLSIRDAVLLKNIGNYITLLFNNNFQMREAQRPPAGGLAWWTVSSVSPATAFGLGQYTFVQTTTPTGFVLTNPLPVVFQKVNKNQLPGFPTNTNVIAVVNTGPPYGIIIPYSYRNTVAYFPNKNMRFALAQYTYTQMFTGQFLRFTTHKTGRCFGTPRGRARSVVRSF